MNNNARDKLARMHLPRNGHQHNTTQGEQEEGDVPQLDAHRIDVHRTDLIRNHDDNGRFAPTAITPKARDEKAAEYMLRGDGVVDAMRRAGFPESRYRRGHAEIARSKGLKIALLNRIMRTKDLPMPSAEDRANIVRRQLLLNLVLGAAKGSNAAAKLLGLDKEVSMWASDAAQGNIYIVAPAGQVNVNTAPITHMNGPHPAELDPPSDDE